MGIFKKLWQLIVRGWEILSTVYSYNSLPWRFLKSGALVVFGFFNFMAGNLLHSYKPHWDFLHFFMAYGSLLIVYGPIHHLAVIPASLRLGRYSWARNLRIPRWGHVFMLVLFFATVVYFSIFPAGFMVFEIEAQGMMGTSDVNPEVSCWRPEEGSSSISCSVSDDTGIARVEVETNGEKIKTIDTAPYRFTIEEANVQEVVGQKSFSIILRDKQGNFLRRFVQQAGLIDPRASADTS